MVLKFSECLLQYPAGDAKKAANPVIENQRSHAMNACSVIGKKASLYAAPDKNTKSQTKLVTTGGEKSESRRIAQIASRREQRAMAETW